MAVTLHETWDSRDPHYGKNGGGETLRYVAVGSTDQVEVFDAAVVQSPAVWDGFIRSDIRLTPMGGPAYRVEVEYGTAGLGGGDSPAGTTPATPTAPGGNGGGTGENGDEPLGAGYSIDISAEQVHITQSIRTLLALRPGDIAGANPPGGTDLAVNGSDNTIVHPVVDGWDVTAADVGKRIRITGGTGWTLGDYKITAANAGGDTWTLDSSPGAIGIIGGEWVMLGGAPDNQGVIGVQFADGSGRAEGCDIFGPKFDWSRDVSRPVVTRNYLRALRNLVGRKNFAPFYGSAPGEVLYLGCSARATDGGKWSLTHKFSEIENRTNIFVTKDLVIPFKRGWDYVWFGYSKKLDAGEIVSRPKAAYVEEVVEDGDFSLIEIGY